MQSILSNTTLIHRKLRLVPVSSDKSTDPAVLTQFDKSVKRCSQSLFSTLNAYFWLHGMGFECGLNFTKNLSLKTLISSLFMIIAEGNFLFRLHIVLRDIHSETDMKENVTNIINLIINCIIRVLLYATRKKMHDAALHLCEIHDQVTADGRPVKIFKMKLVFVLVVNDVLSGYFLFKYLFTFTSKTAGTFIFRSNPSVYAISTVWLNIIINDCVAIHSGFVAYFCTVCFILKQSLIALNENLKSSSEVEHLYKAFLDITTIIPTINCLIHPHLLTVCLLLLGSVFQHAYCAIFVPHVDFRTQDALQAAYLFSEFVCICVYGSSVVNAAAEVGITSRHVAVKFSQLRSLHFLATMREGVEGFKLLNSIAIDTSLILSAVGILLTYGILVATFNTSSNPRGN